MLTYATLLAAYCDSLKAVGAEASLTESEDYIVVHLPGGFYKCLPTIVGTSIHLDECVIKTLTDRNNIGSASEWKKIEASFQNGVGYLPNTLLEFDSSFWHFNNGYSGLSSDQRVLFGNWCTVNHIRFTVQKDGALQHLSGTRLCEIMPDNALIHVVLLQLSLAAMDLLQRFKEEYPEIPNLVYQIGRLIDIFGVSLDVFRLALPTIKGLSKSCGDWSSNENRSVMFSLCSLLDKISTTTNSAYSITPEKLQWASSWSLADKLCLFSDYLRYLRQYASITLVIQSLSYYIVFIDEKTPERKYHAWHKFLGLLGRVAHTLFMRIKYLMEQQDNEVNNDATDC